jgi:hypothetical protein
MSESDDDDRRLNDSDDDGADGASSDDKTAAKCRLGFHHFDELRLLLRAANNDEDLLIETIHRLAAVPGVQPFVDIQKLARVVEEHLKTVTAVTPASKTQVHKQFDEHEGVMVLLNLLYAPRRSRLASLLKTLSRIENASHICAWTKLSNLKVHASAFFV